MNRFKRLISSKNLFRNDNSHWKKKVESVIPFSVNADFANQIYFGKMNNMAIAFCLLLTFFDTHTQKIRKYICKKVSLWHQYHTWRAHSTTIRKWDLLIISSAIAGRHNFIYLTISLKSIWWNKIAIWHIHKRLFSSGFQCDQSDFN